MLDELWDERPPPTASTALQGHVSQLRKILPADRLVTRAPGYLLRVERGERDVDRFEELRSLARSTPERASELLRDALALWRGPALADLADEPFARDEIARLENLRIETLEERIEADLQGWSNLDIVAELETLVARYPLRERLAAQLMRALYRSGRQAEALSAYRRARSNLLNELGIEPTPALRDLHRAILSHDTAVLLPGPRGRSAKIDLPAEPNRFVGRRRELSEVCSELEQGDIRLLTLTGAGGSGKTRIAMRAAAERAGAYGDGVRFIPLAGAQRVAPAIVAGLGLLETPGVEPSDALQSYLAGRHVLLVLDNFEHLLDEAPLLAGLLARNASLQLLVTSREPLRLTAEHEYQVPPLAEEEAVQLFVDRARAVTRDFAANGEVAQICRRLDSLPLAVELAAARARSLSAREILDRLDSSLAFLKDGPRDAPERHQTLRATIEWSRRLLPPAEQRVFLALGVFTGGCTRDAAATVCGADAETLKSLVEKNLLRAHSGRWSMLETIREYAAHELDSSGEGARRRQLHAGYFLDLAERAAPELRRGTRDRLWLDLLTRERANLHAALEWLAERGDGEAAQRLVRALFHFWHDRGPIHEAFQSFTRALALPSSPASRAAALCHGSVFAAWAGGHDLARAWAEEGLPAARAANDHLSVVAALQILGFYLLTEQPDKGAELLEEAVSVARASGEAWAVGITLFTLLNCLVIDDPERAIALGEQAAALENISTSLRAMIVGARAEIAEWHGDLERAVELNREGLTLARRVGSHNDFLYLSSLGWLALLQGDAHEACLLLAESLHLARETGARDRAALILMFLSAATAARGQPLVAGTLHGAVRTHHANVANVPGWSLYRDQISTYLSNARKEAGDDAWADAVERGETLTVDDATRYALDALS